MVRKQDTEKTAPPELIAFGQAVRMHRKALGYSQEAFGDVCGIDRSYMGGIERGEHNLALINILKIIHALKLQPSEFFRAMDRPMDGSVQ
jgi:transcriptional regulator with XRE-family HTH domain